MTRWWTFAVLAAVLCLGSVSRSHAQILGTGVMPVTEIGPNLMQSTITAAQSVITAAQTTYTVANQILDLTPVEELIQGVRVAEDLGALAEVIQQAQALGVDLVTLNAQVHALFDLETAPTTRPALDARLVEIRRVTYQTRTYALQTQALLSTVLCTVDHLLGLFHAIGSLVGNMQGNQRMLEVQITVGKTLAVLETQTAAYQRSETVDKLSAALIKESLSRIAENQLTGWPRWE